MSEARAVWIDLPREEHEFQFNPQRAFPNFNDAQEKRTAANAKARSSLAPHLDLPYGEHKLRRLDIFTAMSAEKASPVHVFVHAAIGGPRTRRISHSLRPSWRRAESPRSLSTTNCAPVPRSISSPIRRSPPSNG
jgi:hypothetical protein